MREYKVEQRTQEWLQLRMGIPTGSEMDRLITTTGKPTSPSRRNGMICEKLSEIVTGQPTDKHVNEYMIHGQETEPAARKSYEYETDSIVAEVGFVTTDDGVVGFSPDGFIGDDGMVEIKCPMPWTHIDYLLSLGTNKYKAQIQSGLWVCEREWCDWYSYCPPLPSVLVRSERDEEYIGILAKIVGDFNKQKAEALTLLGEAGWLEVA